MTSPATANRFSPGRKHHYTGILDLVCTFFHICHTRTPNVLGNDAPQDALFGVIASCLRDPVVAAAFKAGKLPSPMESQPRQPPSVAAAAAAAVVVGTVTMVHSASGNTTANGQRKSARIEHHYTEATRNPRFRLLGRPGGPEGE